MAHLLLDISRHEPVAISMPAERTTEYGISVGNTVAWPRVPAVLIPFLCQIFIPAASQGLVLNAHEQIVKQLTSTGWLVNQEVCQHILSSATTYVCFYFVPKVPCAPCLITDTHTRYVSFLFPTPLRLKIPRHCLYSNVGQTSAPGKRRCRLAGYGVPG